MKRFTTILGWTLLAFSTAHAQKKEKINEVGLYADSIARIAPIVLHGATDSLRIAANIRVIHFMEEVLQFKESYNFPFDSLTTIAHLTAPDKSFRIYNWILPAKDGTFKFFGYIQQYNKKSKTTLIIPLKDASEKIEKAEKSTLGPEKWYGCLYYKILMNKFLGKRYYTLLGWKGYDFRSTKKVIDLLHFVNNKPKFGLSVFKMKKDLKSRLIFQYSAQAVVSLRYVEEEKAIVYDHLSPPSDNLKGQFEFYGPDFTYDALKFKRGKWFLTELFQAKNDKDPNYKKPRKQPVHLVPTKKAE
jgi:hypothetical protein